MSDEIVYLEDEVAQDPDKRQEFLDKNMEPGDLAVRVDVFAPSPSHSTVSLSNNTGEITLAVEDMDYLVEHWSEIRAHSFRSTR